MKKNILNKKVVAFNLQELLVVLVIIGILILIALPNLMPIIAKTKSIEAQNQLKFLYSLQRNYFFMHSKYSNDFKSLDFVPPSPVNKGGNANYSYEIVEASLSSFKAKAVAVVDFDGDGVFNVWEIDQDQKLIEKIKD
ncbi:MAG: prepilin-type N-terminal cleavage/methylation domain-containing protein [Tenacibaculum sp.]